MESFWHFDIGNIATWATLLFTIFLWALRYSRRLTEIGIWLEELGEHNKTLTSVLDRMNSAGTAFSQKLMAVEAEISRQNTRRIELLEQMSAKLGPDIAKMATDVEWIKREWKKSNGNSH